MSEEKSPVHKKELPIPPSKQTDEGSSKTPNVRDTPKAKSSRGARGRNKTSEKVNTNCRYHQKGSCKMGDKCLYNHASRHKAKEQGKNNKKEETPKKNQQKESFEPEPDTDNNNNDRQVCSKCQLVFESTDTTIELCVVCAAIDKVEKEVARERETKMKNEVILNKQLTVGQLASIRALYPSFVLRDWISWKSDENHEYGHVMRQLSIASLLREARKDDAEGNLVDIQGVARNVRYKIKDLKGTKVWNLKNYPKQAFTNLTPLDSLRAPTSIGKIDWTRTTGLIMVDVQTKITPIDIAYSLSKICVPYGKISYLYSTFHKYTELVQTDGEFNAKWDPRENDMFNCGVYIVSNKEGKEGERQPTQMSEIDNDQAWLELGSIDTPYGLFIWKEFAKAGTRSCTKFWLSQDRKLQEEITPIPWDFTGLPQGVYSNESLEYVQGTKGMHQVMPQNYILSSGVVIKIKSGNLVLAFQRTIYEHIVKKIGHTTVLSAATKNSLHNWARGKDVNGDHIDSLCQFVFDETIKKRYKRLQVKNRNKPSLFRPHTWHKMFSPEIPTMMDALESEHEMIISKRRRIMFLFKLLLITLLLFVAVAGRIYIRNHDIYISELKSRKLNLLRSQGTGIMNSIYNGFVYTVLRVPKAVIDIPVESVLITWLKMYFQVDPYIMIVILIVAFIPRPVLAETASKSIATTDCAGLIGIGAFAIVVIIAIIVIYLSERKLKRKSLKQHEIDNPQCRHGKSAEGPILDKDMNFLSYQASLVPISNQDPDAEVDLGMTTPEFDKHREGVNVRTDKWKGSTATGAVLTDCVPVTPAQSFINNAIAVLNRVTALPPNKNAELVGYLKQTFGDVKTFREEVWPTIISDFLDDIKLQEIADQVDLHLAQERKAFEIWQLKFPLSRRKQQEVAYEDVLLNGLDSFDMRKTLFVKVEKLIRLNGKQRSPRAVQPSTHKANVVLGPEIDNCSKLVKCAMSGTIYPHQKKITFGGSHYIIECPGSKYFYATGTTRVGLNANMTECVKEFDLQRSQVLGDDNISVLNILDDNNVPIYPTLFGMFDGSNYDNTSTNEQVKGNRITWEMLRLSKLALKVFDSQSTARGSLVCTDNAKEKQKIRFTKAQGVSSGQATTSVDNGIGQGAANKAGFERCLQVCKERLLNPKKYPNFDPKEYICSFMVAWLAMLGFTPKFSICTNIYEAEFLSGFYVLTIEGEARWQPKIGRFLAKIGWFLTRHQKQRNYYLQLFGGVLHVYKQFLFVPFIGEYVERMTTLVSEELEKHDLDVIYPSWLNKVIQLQPTANDVEDYGAQFPDPSIVTREDLYENDHWRFAFEQIRDRYNLNGIGSLLGFRQQLAKITSLPWAFQSDVIYSMVEHDY